LQIGKTTQLPAYLLEDDPVGAKIVVVQPRRLAATGVAHRVAEERGEKRAGTDSVGYVVRGDSAIGHRTRLVFCTTGVLLRQLQNEGALDCLTTIVVDEVHERNLDGDVLLGLLKQLLPSTPHLSVVLMSATLETERFANYWGSSSVPHIHIPGRTFPVEDFTLEDVLRLTCYITSKNKKTSRCATNRKHRSSPWNDSEKSDDEEGKDDGREEPEQKEVSSVIKHNIPIDDLVKRMDETTPDFDLICRLVRHIVENKSPSDDGSVLIFLAGAPEINQAMETIKRGLKDLPIAPLPLHGGLQPKDQNRVFQPAQKGFTKVVLSTNVAETSVTIPDCTVVIDT
jgi:ATP-dependent RNA helicase DHX57